MDKLTIRQAREKSGIMQKFIPQCIGVSKGTYLNYERKNYMPLDVLEKFSMAVGIPIIQIRCEEPHESSWRHTAIKC